MRRGITLAGTTTVVNKRARCSQANGNEATNSGFLVNMLPNQSFPEVLGATSACHMTAGSP